MHHHVICVTTPIFMLYVQPHLSSCYMCKHRHLCAHTLDQRSMCQYQCERAHVCMNVHAHVCMHVCMYACACMHTHQCHGCVMCNVSSVMWNVAQACGISMSHKHVAQACRTSMSHNKDTTH